MSQVRTLLAQFEAVLAASGIDSARSDAELLLADVLGVDRLRLSLVDAVTAEQVTDFEARIARRAQREPLQHILGRAHFRHVELVVGPGVFVPRPETELLAGWAIEEAHKHDGPVVIDFCTGSGPIAKSLADEASQARIIAVELDEQAHAWAERNLMKTTVDLRLGGISRTCDDLIGEVDIVVANPPYIPLTAWESVVPEARDHDPHLALFSGDDGLDAIRELESVAYQLLKPGGVIGIEHAEVQSESASAIFAERWSDVRDNRDFNERPRFVTARRP